jgi:hypothetical protein
MSETRVVASRQGTVAHFPAPRPPAATRARGYHPPRFLAGRLAAPRAMDRDAD